MEAIKKDMHSLAVTLLFLLYLFGSEATTERPNIIFILGDDLGWNDVGFHGSNQIPTPNIDALAYSGMILHHHYAQPVCTPSRAALMTGRYPSRLGMQGIPLGASQLRALPDGKILPQYLKDLGYVTRHIGKWHLGYYNPKFTPIHRGFDSSLGYYNGLISYYTHICQDPIPKWIQACRDNYTGYTIDFNNIQLYGKDLNRNNIPAGDLEGRYATDLFTEEAVKQIHEHDTSNPLFMYVAHLACHAGNWGQNLEAPQETIDKFKYIIDPNRRTYAAMTSKLDDSVGEIMRALKAKKMLKNSIVIFMSDNGGPTLLSGMWQTPASNYPLRGTKVTQWEGGIRVPAVIYSSLLQKKSQVSKHLIHMSDWLPTLYSAAGGKPDDIRGVPMDGVDQWAALMNNDGSPRTEMMQVYDENLNHTAFRKGDWKLSAGYSQMGRWDIHAGDSGVNSKYPEYSVKKIYKSEAGKAIASIHPLPTDDAILKLRSSVTVKCPKQENATECDTFHNRKPCLFNIANDPCEMNDVSESFPDIYNEMIAMVEEYKKTVVPVGPATYDIDNADPAKHNDNWVPWKHDDVCYDGKDVNC